MCDAVTLHRHMLHAVPAKHSRVLRHRATSVLIQERCSSFVNMVLGARTIPMKINFLDTAVD